MTIASINGVDVVYWNPRRPLLTGRFGNRVHLGSRRNNFGDLLGPEIVARLAAERGLTSAASPARRTRLVSIGSIIHFAEDGDVIWGSGMNGKISDDEYQFSRLDVRAVRGPLTHRALTDRGIDVPAVFGDPGLLAPAVFTELPRWSQEKRHALSIVPNLHDFATWRNHPDVIDPTAPLLAVLERIARSERVVGSSLHGVIIAESLGIPATLIQPGTEPLFKYEDYYRGTGRDTFPVAGDLREALATHADPIGHWSGAELIAAFPSELWASK
jgi:pyruvyltransferase